MKITAVIVEDSRLARNELKELIKEHKEISLLGEAENVDAGFELINQKKPDLLFLDINMPEISGIAFAKSINKSINVIFTTAYRDYAVDGFDLQAVDYIMKPISFERLLKAVNRYFEISDTTVAESNSSLDTHDWIFPRAGRQMLKMDFETIV